MIIADAGFFYALIDRRDAWHSRAVSALDTQAEGWITTWPVLTEATHLLTRWIGTDAAQALLREVADGAIAVWSWPLAHTERMVQLMARYASLPMDLADASLVVAALKTGCTDIWTLDRADFETYRLPGRKHFTLA